MSHNEEHGHDCEHCETLERLALAMILHRISDDTKQKSYSISIKEFEKRLARHSPEGFYIEKDDDKLTIHFFNTKQEELALAAMLEKKHRNMDNPNLPLH